MSVINQMLRDLDDRQVRQPAAQPTAPMMSSESNGTPMRVVAIIVLLAAIVSSVYYFKFYQSDEIVVAEDATQPELVVEQIQTSANESENFVEEQATAVEQQASPVEEQVSAIEQPVEIPLETKLASSAEPVAERAETIVQEQPVQPVAQMITPQVAAEPVTRIIKSNPNESKRSHAEQQYRKFAEDGTSPLTSNEYQQVLAIDPSFHKARIEWLSSLIQSNEGLFSAEASSAMNRWPEVYQYRQMLARLWVLSEPNKAYELLVSDMPTLDSAPDYHGLIAYSAQQMGELDLASKKYELLLENYPERADWWLALGLLQEQLGSQTRALAAYQQSLRFPGLSSSTRSYAEQRVRAIQGY